MIRHRRLVLLLAVVGMMFSVAGVALAVATKVYVATDGVPQGSMSLSAPLPGALIDIDGDGDPGRTVKRGGSGSSETDPNRYQEWEYSIAGTTASVNNFAIWAAAEDMEVGENLYIAGYLFLCNQTCSLLDSSTKFIKSTSAWKKVILNLDEPSRFYGAGDRMVVKIIVTNESEEDVWFAYGTSTYGAHLLLDAPSSTTSSSTSSTTTTATTTTVPSTTTTQGHGTTTTVPSTTTTQGHGTTTTRPHGPTTTTTTAPSPPTASTTIAPSTTTTLPTESTTTTVAALAPGSNGPDEPSGPSGVQVDPVDDPPGETKVGDDIFSPGAFDQSANLKPQVGLMAVYATVSENVNLYWQVALALGALMTVLLIAGFEEKESEADPSRRMQWHSRLRRI